MTAASNITYTTIIIVALQMFIFRHYFTRPNRNMQVMEKVTLPFLIASILLVLAGVAEMLFGYFIGLLPIVVGLFMVYITARALWEAKHNPKKWSGKPKKKKK
ncbi:MAG: hypothetical protein HGA79_11060 [Anaerolineales bacterium]|nr:hypothetical protein [Anaerolineales bacterium]NTW12746.1 hypothetical protein [Anaerolineales bacterium]